MKNTFKFKGNGWIELYKKSEKFLYECDNIIFHKEKNIILFKETEIKKNDGEFITLTTFSKEKSKTLIIFLPKDEFIVKRIIENKDGNDKIWFDNINFKKPTLCCNKFIGEYLVIADPKDLAYGEILERKCSNCFFKPLEEKRCNIIVGKGNLRPRTLFRRRKNEKMPSKIDGKNVAQYCRYFAHFDLE